MKGAFGLKPPTEVPALIEAQLRAELGLSAPIPYTLEDRREGRSDGAMLLHDFATVYFGSAANVLLTAHFAPETPRPLAVDVKLLRFGVGTFLGPLLYAAPLAGTLTEALALDPPGRSGVRFSGDAAASGRLNAGAELLKRADKFARTKVNYGGAGFEAKRLFRLVPQAGGVMLVAGTFARLHWLSGAATLDAAEFLDLAGLIEAALGG